MPSKQECHVDRHDHCDRSWPLLRYGSRQKRASSRLVQFQDTLRYQSKIGIGQHNLDEGVFHKEGGGDRVGFLSALEKGARLGAFGIFDEQNHLSYFQNRKFRVWAVLSKFTGNWEKFERKSCFWCILSELGRERGNLHKFAAKWRKITFLCEKCKQGSKNSAAFRGIPWRPPKTRKFLVQKRQKTRWKWRFWAVFDQFSRPNSAAFRGIPRHSAAKRQMVISEQKAPNQPFLAKKLPKIAEHQCCRIFRLDTGNSEAKTRILAKKAENFAFHGRSCLAGSFVPTFNHIPWMFTVCRFLFVLAFAQPLIQL